MTIWAPYRQVVMGPVTVPANPAHGSAWCSVKPKVKNDKKIATGKNGSTHTLQGLDDADVTVSVRVVQAGLADLEGAIQALWPPSEAVRLVHRNAQLHRVDAFMIEKPSGLEWANGAWIYSWSGSGWSTASGASATGATLLLMRGSVGAEVKRWQAFLLSRGFDPQGIDGVFGANTDAATRAFQAAEGITVDGIVGPQTFGAAAKYGYAPPPPQAGGSVTRTPTKASPAAPGAPKTVDEILAQRDREKAESDRLIKEGADAARKTEEALAYIMDQGGAP